MNSIDDLPCLESGWLSKRPTSRYAMAGRMQTLFREIARSRRGRGRSEQLRGSFAVQPSAASRAAHRAALPPSGAANRALAVGLGNVPLPRGRGRSGAPALPISNCKKRRSAQRPKRLRAFICRAFRLRLWTEIDVDRIGCMSKAFTRESDDLPDSPAALSHVPALPPGTKNYMTPGGARRLRENLDRLVQMERPLAAASPNGDEARRLLRRLDQRILHLEQSLESAEIVSAPPPTHDQVRF